jgi:VanZ family protein
MAETSLPTPAPAVAGPGRRWFWAGLFAATIFLASSCGKVSSPGLTQSDDKYGHFLVYGLLGTLVCRTGRGWRAGLLALAAASLYGVSDEWHQSFVPGRSCDVWDWVADTSGAALAIGLYLGVTGYRRLLEATLWTRRKAA